MVLTELLKGVRVIKLYSGMYGKMVLTQDTSVNTVRYDSRQVGPGDMFVALRGTAVDGHRFILPAMRAGAAVVVVDDDNAIPDTMFMHEGILKVLVPDTRVALAQIAANYFRHPGDRLGLVGVTGTNGKTTTTHLVKSILEADGKRAGLIGTIEYRVGETIVPATHTTPESLELNALLAAMAEAGCTGAVMEVSSHALAMHRVDGIPFRAGVFTNLTQDHLDYHGTMEEYFRAKKTLFDRLEPDAVAVSNADDPYGIRMLEGVRSGTLTYGSAGHADVRASDIVLDIRGSGCNVHAGGRTTALASPLTGRFNVSNILAAFATGFGLGIRESAIVAGITSVKAVRGRFEQMNAPGGWTAVIDYAHTPDALENCLRTIGEIAPRGKGGRIITLFGCGGNRDRGKRPIMGRIAASMSDEIIVTSDNPRLEDPQSIIDEVLAGVPRGTAARSVVDRHEAISMALKSARRGDVILIAGKGHETYQVIGTTKVHFDDREEVEMFLRENG
jgi:UDP-N-acetylmuramoyl-L-alanyl-D-glutamate--2,6-diaminopimelate ligase